MALGASLIRVRQRSSCGSENVLLFLRFLLRDNVLPVIHEFLPVTPEFYLQFVSENVTRQIMMSGPTLGQYGIPLGQLRCVTIVVLIQPEQAGGINSCMGTRDKAGAFGSPANCIRGSVPGNAGNRNTLQYCEVNLFQYSF